MAITESGKQLWAEALSNAVNGYASTEKAESYSSTQLKAKGTPFAAGVYVGQDVYVESASGLVVGTILENSTSVLTVARWETPGGGRGGSPATTPSAQAFFVIASGATPAQWMALGKSATTHEKVSEWEASSEEFYEGSSGMNRALAIFSVTSKTAGSAGKYTLTKKFELLKATEFKINSIGVFNCANTANNNKGPTGQRMLFWTALSSTATLSSIGDSVEITDTVTGS